MLEVMARWEVTLIGKKGHRYGVIEARDEREATVKAAEDFQIPRELRFKIAVARIDPPGDEPTKKKPGR